jgi:SAM-dependent methyltransferase
MSVRSHSDEYFDSIGLPNPGEPFSLIDDYRFRFVFRHLRAGSVLDVGVYYGDFLKLAREGGHDIFGTEVNSQRVGYANGLIGEEVVSLGFRNGSLSHFQNHSVDNVVCMEVIEHVADHEFALSELCRVARKRVIVTVPYKETIREHICIHCCKSTPYCGHLHSYDVDVSRSIVPAPWKIIACKPFVNLFITTLISLFKLPRNPRLLPFLRAVSWLPIRRRWLLAVLER